MREDNNAPLGCAILGIGLWLCGVVLFVGFWGFVLYMAWKLVTHITGG